MNEIAKPGYLWVCAACGKVSRDRYGDATISKGWDESCMLNAVEVAEERLIWNPSRTRVRGVGSEGDR